jgi:beta-glucosidase
MTPKIRSAKTLSIVIDLTLFAFCALGVASAQTSSPPKQLPYQNPALSIDQRVDDLVGRMTLEEKASQVVHKAVAIPRLGVPAYNWWHEALHGVLAKQSTVFPEPIGLGATFDSPLIHEMGTAISYEARAKYEQYVAAGNFDAMSLDFWAPNINIFRDPRWGRGQETYGEDPFLTSRMGVAFVTGMQGDDPKYLRVIATPKHYDVHSGPEPTRHTADVQVSKHDEEDTYLVAFRAAITEAHAGSIMCAYNSINGQPACANEFLLQNQLRDHWKFEGYVVSDCDAVRDIWRTHHYTQTAEQAAAISMRVGTDLDCNTPGNDYSHYLAAVKQGLLPEKDLDTSVKRLMRARFELGMFDPPAMVKYASTPLSEIESPEHRALALRTSKEAMVLLKNDGTLPLKPGIRTIAVVGPLADNTLAMFGNYHGRPSASTTPLAGIRQEFKSATVTFTAGTNFLRDLVPVPTSVLRTPDGKPGLSGAYFKGTDLAGRPVVTRVDAQVNFEFTGHAPAPGLEATDFSVRWTGTLTPAASGAYELGFTGDDGYRMWIDGKQVVEDWRIHAPTTKSTTITLEKGHAYAIKIEYFQKNNGAEARLIWTPTDSDPLSAAVEQAKNADVIVAVVGITSRLEGEEMKVNQPGFLGGDRTSLDLPAQEETLLEGLKATGKPLVVVLINGSALAVNWAQQNANAILEAWYPGEDGGAAIAQTLSGANNPAGRLPVTFYKGVDQLPPFEDYSMSNRTYRYFSGTPLFPFGYGGSYSTFAYSRLKIEHASIQAGQPLTVQAEVKNTSTRDGDEVAELYVTYPQLAGAPVRALKGFTRVHLAAGASAYVSFTVSPRDLSIVNPKGDRVIAAGEYGLSVGGGQPGTTSPTLTSTFQIKGDMMMPE